MSYTIKAYEKNKPNNFFTFRNKQEYVEKIDQIKEYLGYVPLYSYRILIPENKTGIIF